MKHSDMLGTPLSDVSIMPPLDNCVNYILWLILLTQQGVVAHSVAAVITDKAHLAVCLVGRRPDLLVHRLLTPAAYLFDPDVTLKDQRPRCSSSRRQGYSPPRLRGLRQ